MACSQEVAAFVFIPYGEAAVAGARRWTARSSTGTVPGPRATRCSDARSARRCRARAARRWPRRNGRPCRRGACPDACAGPAPGTDGRYCLDQRLDRVAVVDVGSRDPDGQRDALRLGQHMQLAARLAAIDGIRAGQRPPFFRRDRRGVDDHRCPVQLTARPSSSSTARCSHRHSPALVHCPNRRCAVWNGTRRRRQIPPCTRWSRPLLSANPARSSAVARWLRGIRCREETSCASCVVATAQSVMVQSHRTGHPRADCRCRPLHMMLEKIYGCQLGQFTIPGA